MRKILFHILLIAIVGIVIYSNTLNAPFLWDDRWIIVENKNIKDLSNFTDFSGTRYLTFLSFAINYRLNGLDVTGYHIFNIAVHLLNAMLIYLLITIIFRTPYLRNHSVKASKYQSVKDSDTLTLRYFDTSQLIPLFSGLIFVSHPVYTMAVTNINQRSILLTTFFYLLSLIMYIKWRLKENSFISENKSGVSPDSQAGSLTYNNEPSSLKIDQASCLTTRFSLRWTLYIISLISAIFAMKCKEVSFTLPIIILLFERFFFKDRWKKSIIYTIPILLTLLIIPLSKPQPDVFNVSAIDAFRIEDESVLTGLSPKTLSEIPRKDYTLTEVRVILTYIRLFFLPFNLNLAYDYPIYKSFLEPNVILSFLLIVIIFVVAVYICYRPKLLGLDSELAAYDSRLTFFGFLWFFITISIESFVVVLNYVIFEYRLYLPSIGFILLLPWLSSYVITHFKKKSRYVSVAVILIVLIFSAASYMRNEVFKNAVTLWEDVAKKSPYKAEVHHSLGNVYLGQKRLADAIKEYQTALELKPDYTNVHYNLGNAYLDHGFFNDAIKEFQIAIRLQPDYAEAHNNLGTTYFSKSLIDKAIEHYQVALRLKPDFADAHYNLSIAYGMRDYSNKASEKK